MTRPSVSSRLSLRSGSTILLTGSVCTPSYFTNRFPRYPVENLLLGESSSLHRFRHLLPSVIQDPASEYVASLISNGVGLFATSADSLPLQDDLTIGIVFIL